MRLYDYFDSKNKFQTIVGERGKIIWRVSTKDWIARELHSDPELMVFRSTSALDFNTEDQILDCIKNLSKDITFTSIS